MLQASTLIEDKKGGTSKKIGGRRRDREAEVTVTGQERSLKRRRNRQDDIVLSAGATLSLTNVGKQRTLHETDCHGSCQNLFKHLLASPFCRELNAVGCPFSTD